MPKRFVVPRVSAKDFQNQRNSFFEDENNAVTHLGELNRQDTISKVVALLGLSHLRNPYNDFGAVHVSVSQ